MKTQTCLVVANYEEHYNSVQPIVLANENRFTQANIDDIQVDEGGPPEHVWSDIAPSTEESRSRSLCEGNETLTELSQEDLQDNSDLLNTAGSVSTATGLSARFEGSANRKSLLMNAGDF